MQRIIVVSLLAVLSGAVAWSQTLSITEATVVSLYRGTAKISEHPSWDACRTQVLALAKASTQTSGTVTYACKTEVRKVVATYSLTPVPVSCVVSAFTFTSAGPWGACVNNMQTRPETWTRTVIVPASNGGTPCPALTEIRTGTQACTPPGLTQCSDGVDNDSDGLVDLADPGCTDAADNSEETNPPLAQCQDGLDNDKDGRTDFPTDTGCSSATDNDETDLPSAVGTLFVDGATGDDSRTRAQAAQASTPWRTIGRALWGSTNRNAPNAAQAAQAGDVVSITPGVYQTTGTNTNGFGGVALAPVNSGTPGAPIRIQSVNNVPCSVRVQFTSGGGSVIGAVFKHDIVFSGFTLNETDTPWSTAVGFQSAQFWTSDSQNITIENSCFQGTRTSARDGDNYALMRFHGSDGITVRNNECSQVGLTDENSTCMTWYFTRNVTVESNEFHDVSNAIYAKDNRGTAASGHTIRLNRFRNSGRAISLLLAAHATEAQPTRIYQNVTDNVQFPMNVVSLLSSSDTTHAKILNNTFYRQQGTGEDACVRFIGVITADAGIVVQNNICQIAVWAINGWGGSTTSDLVPAKFTADRNVYTGISSTHALFGGVSIPFATWQSTYGLDVAGLQADPLFVNAAQGDFHLASTSPARDRGRARYGVGGPDGTVIPAGAYITGTEVIGRR